MDPNFATSALYALDNLEVMRGMDSETVHLIYADPPFNSKRLYQGMAGTKAAGHKFRDTWSWNDAKEEWLDQFANDWPVIADLLKVARAHSDGMAGYLAFMAVRVIEMQRILRKDGSLYLHCDPTASNYLRMLLDIVFGAANFRNEMVWYYENASRGQKQWAKSHDIMLYYGKVQSEVLFNRDAVLVPYKSGMTAWRYKKAGKEPPAGKTPDDVIVLPSLNTMDKERTGWSTQKPLALLERIIKASSNPGDIVFDPFCGCGTALVAAEQLGRRWVGADDDANAVEVIKERIANLTGTIADSPQLQHRVSVIGQPPTRTVTPDETAYRDPTGYIVPARPSDKMTNAAIRELLLLWQTEPDGCITCIGCAERLKPRHFHCDHIDPKAQGGSNRIDNRIMLCGACNGQKSNTKALAALWKENGVRGAERKRMQGLLAEVRSKARRLVQQLDTGAAMQQAF